MRYQFMTLHLDKKLLRLRRRNLLTVLLSSAAQMYIRGRGFLPTGVARLRDSMVVAESNRPDKRAMA